MTGPGGANPTPPLASGSPSEQPSSVVPHTIGGGVAASIARALNQAVRVIPIDEEEGCALLVEPLHFHRVYRAAGGVKVSRVHASLNTAGAKHDPE
ncbi:MAG: hypothetical protein JNM03_10665 [Sphingopyxis sp.]|uniref:hypothetical protein n=1 Tax=Sphingopyxis sp. TaxID=1908224 RepID=UPI001A5E4A72|nr:hypothetical protein [Sphingopyxis sp.]MBL9070440.1 hypothetical protein [Sphingopyxis sp.]